MRQTVQSIDFIRIHQNWNSISGPCITGSRLISWISTAIHRNVPKFVKIENNIFTAKSVEFDCASTTSAPVKTEKNNSATFYALAFVSVCELWRNVFVQSVTHLSLLVLRSHYSLASHRSHSFTHLFCVRFAFVSFYIIDDAIAAQDDEKFLFFSEIVWNSNHQEHWKWHSNVHCVFIRSNRLHCCMCIASARIRKNFTLARGVRYRTKHFVCCRSTYRNVRRCVKMVRAKVTLTPCSSTTISVWCAEAVSIRHKWPSNTTRSSIWISAIFVTFAKCIFNGTPVWIVITLKRTPNNSNNNVKSRCSRNSNRRRCRNVREYRCRYPFHSQLQSRIAQDCRCRHRWNLWIQWMRVYWWRRQQTQHST